MATPSDPESGKKAHVTQKQIAAAAKVHPSTVSLALHGHPSIPRLTQERIRRIARELRYRPDPALHALAAYRRRHRESGSRRGHTLALLDNWPEARPWHHHPGDSAIFRGLLSRARELGFTIREFHLGQDAKEHRRVSRVLFQSGVTGVLLAPSYTDGTKRAYHLDWKHFSVVNLGNRLIHPIFPSSMPDLWANYRRLISILHARGYRRFAFYFPYLTDKADSPSFDQTLMIRGFLSANDLQVVPALVLKEWKEEAFLDWYRKHCPEVVLTSEAVVPGTLRKAGFRVPRDVGVAFTPYRVCRGGSGIYCDGRAIGAAAVELLQSQMHLRQRGIPAHPWRISHPGTWQEGNTVLRRVPLRPRL